MSKILSGPKAATPNGKDSPSRGRGYREIGIAAVAAAVRCQQLPVPDDERVAKHVPDTASVDYVG